MDLIFPASKVRKLVDEFYSTRGKTRAVLLADEISTLVLPMLQRLALYSGMCTRVSQDVLVAAARKSVCADLCSRKFTSGSIFAAIAQSARRGMKAVTPTGKR